MNTIIIQARMDSTRLPGKVMLPLANKPVLEHVIDGAKDLQYLLPAGFEIAIATTDLPEDDVIQELAYKTGVKCYRYFDPGNVAHRFRDIASKCKYVVRLTGDNPFVPMEIPAEMIRMVIANKFEYGQVYGHGKRVEVIEKEALFSKCHDEEHVTKDANFTSRMDITIPDGISLDTQEDYNKLKMVYG